MKDFLSFSFYKLSPVKMIFAHYLYFFFVYEIIFVLCKIWSPLYLQLFETVHSASFITGFF